MPLPSYTLAADATPGLPAGDYVPAAVAQQLEATLSKLVWHVLYGKSYDASTLAVSAEQFLGTLGTAQA